MKESDATVKIYSGIRLTYLSVISAKSSGECTLQNTKADKSAKVTNPSIIAFSSKSRSTPHTELHNLMKEENSIMRALSFSINMDTKDRQL